MKPVTKGQVNPQAGVESAGINIAFFGNRKNCLPVTLEFHNWLWFVSNIMKT